MNSQSPPPMMPQSSQPNVAEVGQPVNSQSPPPMMPQSSQPNVAEVGQPVNSQAHHPIEVPSGQSSRARNIITVISPVPQAEKSGARKRRVESAEVLTASPYKKMLLDKMCKRTDAKQKPRVQTSKRKKSNDVVPKRKKKLTCR